METLQLEKLSGLEGLQHAITTRSGGVSSGEYSSLNLGLHVGDERGSVVTNRQRVGCALGYDASTLVSAQQVHGAQSQVVTREYSGRGALDWESAVPDCDALIVAQPNIPAMILVADCAPILLVDPANRVLATVHAGWRGAVERVVSRTIERMQQEFGTKARDVLAGVGPCLCVSCFEVGEEVAAQAPNTCVAGDYEKPHLDLRAMVHLDLLFAGVLADNVEVLERCPRCENETFFSHRAQGGTAGRFGLVAWWE